MWDGIYVEPGAKVVITSASTFLAQQTTIRDAENAVVLKNGGNVSSYAIDHTVFDKNYIDIKMLPYNNTVSPVNKITSSTFSRNTAGSSGGGIFTMGALTISDSTLSYNSAATQYGGGLVNFDSAIVGHLERLQLTEDFARRHDRVRKLWRVVQFQHER